MTEPAATDPPAPQVGGFRRVATYLYIAALVVGTAVIAAAQMLPQVAPDHELLEFGPSATNLATLGLGLLLAAITVLWLLVAAPLRLTTRLLLIAALIVPPAAVLASAQRVDLSGDMWPSITFDQPRLADGTLLADEEPVKESDDDAADLPEPSEADVLEYRGPRRDGVFPVSVLPDGFPERDALDEAWRRPLGLGYAGISVLGDFVVTMDQVGPTERIVCLDAATGSLRWTDQTETRFSEAAGGEGPRSTPTIHDGRVYALGANGHLTCVGLATGKRVWQTDTLGEMGLTPTMWGQASSPLIVGDRVCVGVGGPNAQQANGLSLYDIETGRLVARSDGRVDADGRPQPFSADEFPMSDGEQEQNAVGYASPQRATIAGRDVILNFDGFGLRVLDPQTLEQAAFFEWTNGPRVNVAQPLVFEDDRILLSASYGVGSVMLQAGLAPDSDGLTLEPVWESKRLRSKFASPVALGGFIYGLDEGILTCLAAADGKRQWKGGRYGHGQIVLVGETIVAQAEDGQLVGVAATPDEHRELFSQPIFEAARNWNPPTAAGGAVYVRNHEEIVKLR